MLIAIFGESCTGKSSIADMLAKKTNARIFSGKDYLRLAKSEGEAQKLFSELLKQAVSGSDSIIYVISEKEHMKLLPESCFRVLVTADISSIKERFKNRMHGTLPQPVEKLLENKHGCFDAEACNLHINTDNTDTSDACGKILDSLNAI